MGKNLKNADLVQRTGKVAFFKPVSAGNTGEFPYKRMEGFTELTTSKNPKEYSRQYIDEDFERTDVVGYATSISYAFDKYKGNDVLDDIVKITDEELIGEDAVREIVVVDMSTVTKSGAVEKADAYLRRYSVIPDSEGDTTDCLTYSGTFKTRGEMEKVTAYSYNEWQGLRLEGLAEPLLTELSVEGVTLSPSFSSTTYSYTATTTEVSARVTATANSEAYNVVILCNGSLSQGAVYLNKGENTVKVVVAGGGYSKEYTITITRE
jgi:hypothetical protein